MPSTEPVEDRCGVTRQGVYTDYIVAEYPQLTLADIRAALEFAAAVVDERQLPLRTPA